MSSFYSMPQEGTTFETVTGGKAFSGICPQPYPTITLPSLIAREGKRFEEKNLTQNIELLYCLYEGSKRNLLEAYV